MAKAKANRRRLPPRDTSVRVKTFHLKHRCGTMKPTVFQTVVIQTVFMCSVKMLNSTPPERVAELLGELCDILWDVILLSETRATHGHTMIEGGHVLITSLESTNAAGVALLVHSRHAHQLRQVKQFSDRLVYADL